jgi:hypothetical protein
MDRFDRITHLQDLLNAHQGLMERLASHRDHLLTHHVSRERDRALLHAEKSLRRAEKLKRSLERALRNESKTA